MELTDPHHQQADQLWAFFLLSKLFLYQLLSTLHISVSAPAVKETHKSIKHTVTGSCILAANYFQTRNAQ